MPDTTLMSPAEKIEYGLQLERHMQEALPAALARLDTILLEGAEPADWPMSAGQSIFVIADQVAATLKSRLYRAKDLEELRNLRHLIKQCLGDAPADGPGAIGVFTWKGIQCDTLGAANWKVVSHLWNRPAWRDSIEAVAAACDTTVEAVEKSSRRATETFSKAGIPLELSVKRGNISMSINSICL